MVIKNLKCVWCKREEKEFKVKKGNKVTTVTTDNLLWLTFLADEINEGLSDLYKELDKKDPQYESENGVYLNFNTKYDIPCVFENKKYKSFEKLVNDRTISTNNMMCDIAINSKGYIGAINIVENGESYDPIDEFGFEELDSEELPFN